jgi:hypothetical protein
MAMVGCLTAGAFLSIVHYPYVWFLGWAGGGLGASGPGGDWRTRLSESNVSFDAGVTTDAQLRDVARISRFIEEFAR